MNLENLRPLNGQVLVIDDKVKEKTEGGIFLPNNKNPEHTITGIVIASSEIREDGNTRPPDVLEGDKVFYSFHAGAGNVFQSDDGNLARIVRHNEIIAIIKEDKEC